MKKLLFLLLFLALSATLIMCSSEQKQEATTGDATEIEATETEAAESESADADKVMCEGGCGMEMDKAQMVTHEMDGETHYYCSENCKENHLKKMEEEKKTEM
jgi:YHS domain-containing protein